jgi:hypothetical protein
MLTLTSKAKIALAVVVICAALVVVWRLVDPLAHLVILLDVQKGVRVTLNAKVPVSAHIDKTIDVELPENFTSKVLLKVPIDLGTLKIKKESVRVHVQ